MSTLSEVARTGRKFFRRSVPSIQFWLEGLTIHNTKNKEPVMFDAEEITAIDWEAEQLRMEVTADDVIRAARELDELCSKRKLSAAEFGKAICIELGLLEES